MTLKASLHQIITMKAEERGRVLFVCPANRYEEDFDPLVLGVHGGDAHTLLAGLIHLHLRPQLSVEDQTQAALGTHH